MNCVRLLFCIYNFIFLIIGGTLLGFGIWFAVDTKAEGLLQDLLRPVGETETTDDIVSLIEQAAYVLIGFGGFIFLLSFLGYCGAVKESRFLLGFYTFLLTLIFILEIVAVCVVLFYYGPQIEDETKKLLKDNLEKNYMSPDDKKNLTGTMDEFMTRFQCCGINNSTDFKNVLALKGSYPAACCKKGSDGEGCPPSFTELNSNKDIGCYDRLKDELLSTGGRTWSIIVGVVVGVLQLIGIVFSCFIYKQSRYSFA